MTRGWRLLSLFWASCGGAALATVAVLAVLGPPRRPAGWPSATHAASTRTGRAALVAISQAAVVPTRHAALAAPRHPVLALTRDAALAPAPFERAHLPAAVPPARGAPGAVTTASADPSLLIESGDAPGRMLPAIAPDGRRSSAVYAAAVPPVLPGQARLALVVDGIGLDHRDSLSAIRDLPAPVSLAVSPYAEDLAPLVAEARGRGHEVFVSLPMEPTDSAVADEGDHAIRPDATDAANARNLEWALSAAVGIVGATAAEASGNGAHMAAAALLFRHDIAETLAADGLLYIAPEAETPPSVAGLPVAGADLSIEADASPDELGRKLETLADDAVRSGSALGTLGPPIPSTAARLEAFLRTLPARGIVLVPASALAAGPGFESGPPEDAAAEEATR